MTGLVVSPVPASHAVGSSSSVAGITRASHAMALSATTSHTYAATHRGTSAASSSTRLHRARLSPTKAPCGQSQHGDVEQERLVERGREQEQDAVVEQVRRGAGGEDQRVGRPEVRAPGEDREEGDRDHQGDQRGSLG